MKIKYINKIMIFVVSLNAIISPTNKAVETRMNRSEYHDMIILVHGTILPTPSISALNKTLKKDNSVPDNAKLNFNDRYLGNLRFKSFHGLQPINNLGLIKIDNAENSNDPIYLKTTKKIINSYKNVDKRANSKTYNEEDLSFYTFGWTGTLNKKIRLSWAKKLYDAIIKEKTILEKELKDKKIRIKLMAHSHGGNVCLNLAKAEQELKKNIEIEELALLGTPIQNETKTLVSSPIFKNIYNIYSTGDIVQIVDIISTDNHISQRTFKDNPKTGFKVPDKVKQIEIKAKNQSPLHPELWFWGEAGNFLYRKSFPTYPNPVVVYTPLIIERTKKHIGKNNFSFNLN